MRDHAWPREIGDREDHGPAVDITEISPVRPFRIHIRVVGPVTCVADVEGSRMSRRHWSFIPIMRARIPPAAKFRRLGRIRDVDGAVELIVEEIARRNLRSAGRHMHRPAVHEPQLVNAARERARAVVERDPTRRLGCEISKSSKPAGCSPRTLTSYATAMMSPVTSSELERTVRCGSSD